MVSSMSYTAGEVQIRASQGWTGMTALLQPDGHGGWVQPIGADPRRDFSAESWEVYGTGAFLLAGSEVIKLK